VPLIACTATATTQVIDDIKTTLRLHDSKCHIGSFDRPNIFYEVRYKDSLEALAVGGATKDLVAFINKQHQRCDKRDLPCSGIVYCHTRADTTGLAAAIQKETGIRAVSYHGGMKADERTRVQQSWTCGAAPIAVATVAFGMGIDLAQVRYVVHWNFSKTPEAFYQESGRAGRDDLPAFSLLYYSKDDEAKFRYFLSQKKSKDDSTADDSPSAKRDQNALQEMVNYCIVPGCRRSCLLKHFGEEMTDPTEICVDKCDYCLEPDKVRQAIEAAGAVGDFVCYKRGPPQAQLTRNPVDDDEDDEDDHFGAPLKVGDLRVSGSGAYMELVDTDYSAKPSANFERASSVLKKYEAIERKGSDFVNFKAKSDSMDAVKSNDRIRIPQHLIPPKTANANGAMSNGTASTKEKSSSDFAAEADQLRDAIAKANARQLELVNRTKARRMPPPPPPSVAFTAKRKR
jgi:superfamily II DNA/RNA helicase